MKTREREKGNIKNISALVAKKNSEVYFLRKSTRSAGDKIQVTRKLMFKTGQH